jgi:hypothetical protein
MAAANTVIGTKEDRPFRLVHLLLLALLLP